MWDENEDLKKKFTKQIFAHLIIYISVYIHTMKNWSFIKVWTGVFVSQLCCILNDNRNENIITTV